MLSNYGIKPQYDNIYDYCIGKLQFDSIEHLLTGF